MKTMSISGRLIKEICKFPESIATQCDDADEFYRKGCFSNRYVVINAKRQLVRECRNIEEAHKFVRATNLLYLSIERWQGVYKHFMWYSSSLDDLTTNDLMKLLLALKKVKK